MPDKGNRHLKAAKDVPPLRSVYIYITEECNQRCPHCWINPVPEGTGKINWPQVDDYCRFIGRAAPLGVNYVKFTGGEPLLRKEIYPIIEFTSGLNIYIGIETNAMTVGEKEAEFFKKHGVQLSVSLDGASAAVHDRRRGLPGAFDRTLGALRILAQVGIPLTVTASISRGNAGELEGILELLRDIKGAARIDLKINPIVPMGRAQSMAKRGETLEPHELLSLVGKVRTDWFPRYRKQGIGIVIQLEMAFFPIESMIQKAGTSGAGHCGFLNLISILADGSISFCGIGYTERDLVMGNICDDYDLQMIWDSHLVLADIRNKVRHALEGVCRLCLFHPICLGGCRAAAMAAGGSIDVSPPFCQALFDGGLFPLSRLKPEALAEYSVTAPRLRAEYESRLEGDSPNQHSAAGRSYANRTTPRVSIPSLGRAE